MVQGVLKVKDKTVSGISLAILGALIFIVPKFLISGHCLSMQMKCFWTAKTEFYIGIFIVILAFLFLYFESREMKSGISLSLALFGFFSVIVTAFMGYCNGSCSAVCSCSPVSSVIMIVLSILVTLISFLNFISLNKKS